jgi:hypothetical protein
MGRNRPGGSSTRNDPRRSIPLLGRNFIWSRRFNFGASIVNWVSETEGVLSILGMGGPSTSRHSTCCGFGWELAGADTTVQK